MTRTPATAQDRWLQTPTTPSNCEEPPKDIHSASRSWDRPDWLVTAAFGATVAWVLIFALAPLFYLLVRCSPPFGKEAAADDVPTPVKVKHDVVGGQGCGGAEVTEASVDDNDELTSIWL